MDEISSLREEIKQLKDTRKDEINKLEDYIDIREELSDIKKLVMQGLSTGKENNVRRINQVPSSYADASTSGSVSYAATAARTVGGSVPSGRADGGSSLSVMDGESSTASVPDVGSEVRTRRGDESMYGPDYAAVAGVSAAFGSGAAGPSGVVDSSWAMADEFLPVMDLGQTGTGPGPVSGGVFSVMPKNTTNQGWMTVQRKRRNKGIVGNKKSSLGNFKGAEKVGDIYVGGCNRDTTIEDIKTFCEENLGIKVLKCSNLNSKSEYMSSFKVTLNMNEREKILLADLWPENIVVRKFHSYRGN